MKTLIGNLLLTATLTNLPVGATAEEPAKAPSKADAQAPQPDPPPTQTPNDPPPPPPAARPDPPSEPRQGPPQQKTAPAGQWVYTSQYGWVWMPYGDGFTHVPPDGSPPNMYVYYPEAGWCWVVAPWLWGWGPMPYFGLAGPRSFAWFGIGLGRWHGFAGPYHSWGWSGRAYWNGGRWYGVNRFHDGPGWGGAYRGRGGFSRGSGRSLHR